LASGKEDFSGCWRVAQTVSGASPPCPYILSVCSDRKYAKNAAPAALQNTPTAAGPLVNSPGKTSEHLFKDAGLGQHKRPIRLLSGAALMAECKDKSKPHDSYSAFRGAAVSSFPSVAQSRLEDQRRGRVPHFPEGKAIRYLSIHCRKGTRPTALGNGKHRRACAALFLFHLQVK
jgi:hypothetical protein